MANITYDESAALMSDATFRGRIKVACLQFATYILNEAPDVEAHNTRIKWAQTTMLQPDQAAFQAQPPTVMDPNVQAQGSAIPDDQLQIAVETALKKLL